MPDDQRSITKGRVKIEDLEGMLTSQVVFDERNKIYQDAEGKLEFLNYVANQIDPIWRRNTILFFAEQESLTREQKQHVVRESMEALSKGASFLSEVKYKDRSLDQAVYFDSEYRMGEGFYSFDLELLRHMGYLSVDSRENHALRTGFEHDVYLTATGVELVEIYRRLVRD